VVSNFWQQVRQGFDSVVRGSKRSVELIAESMRRQAAVQKLTARIRGLNRERSQLIRSIGKKVYSLHTQGNVRNRDVLSDCLRIDEAAQEIEGLQDQIEDLRRQAAAGEELVVHIEDETPLTEEPEEEPGPVELPAEQAAEPAGEELVVDVESEAPVTEEAEEEEGAPELPDEQTAQPRMQE